VFFRTSIGCILGHPRLPSKRCFRQADPKHMQVGLLESSRLQTSDSRLRCPRSETGILCRYSHTSLATTATAKAALTTPRFRLKKFHG